MAIIDEKHNGKGGVIMKCESGFQYYAGPGDNSLRPIKETYKSGKSHGVFTIKVNDTVRLEIENTLFVVNPDGSYEVKSLAVSKV